MKKISVLISIFAFATGIASAQNWLGNLVVNGDFNDPASTAPPTGWTEYGVVGGTWVNHEIVSPGNLIDMNDGSVHPNNTGNYDGTYEMSIGTGNGSMAGEGVYQIVAGTAGLTYKLTVDAGAQGWWWPNGYAYLDFLDAGNNILAGSVVINTTAGISAFDIGVPWQNFTVSAVAPAGTTQVEVNLEEQGGGTCWFDNAILEIPEPSTLAMLAIGSLGFFGWRRISRRA